MSDETLLLVLRCTGLNVLPKASFQNVGLLSGLYIRATQPTVAKNEKRTLKLFKTDPSKASFAEQSV
jgi:hypothetical protein